MIKLTGDKCRWWLISYANYRIVEIENQFNNLVRELQQFRQEDEFNEIDLNEIRTK